MVPLDGLDDNAGLRVNEAMGFKDSLVVLSLDELLTLMLNRLN